MQLLERGVYLPHVLENGHHFLAIVDHTHNVIHREPIRDLSDVPAAVEYWKAWLDKEDPISLAA